MSSVAERCNISLLSASPARSGVDTFAFVGVHFDVEVDAVEADDGVEATSRTVRFAGSCVPNIDPDY